MSSRSELLWRQTCSSSLSRLGRILYRDAAPQRHSLCLWRNQRCPPRSTVEAAFPQCQEPLCRLGGCLFLLRELLECLDMRNVPAHRGLHEPEEREGRLERDGIRHRELAVPQEF